MIPSLHTFLEDSKWLEPAAKVLRQLLPHGSRVSIRCELSNYFGMDLWQENPSGPITMEAAFGQAYRTIWLFALRNFAELGDIKPRRDSRSPSGLHPRSQAEYWYRLIGEAKRLGFDLPLVRSTGNVDAVLEGARAAILDARPSTHYEIASGSIDEVAGFVTERFRLKPQPLQADPSALVLTSDIPQSFKLSRRCGRMYEHAYLSNQQRFTPQNVYDSHQPVMLFAVTPLAIAIDIFKAFMGNELTSPAPALSDESRPSCSNGDQASVAEIRHFYVPGEQAGFPGNSDSTQLPNVMDFAESAATGSQNTHEQTNTAETLPADAAREVTIRNIASPPEIELSIVPVRAFVGAPSTNETTPFLKPSSTAARRKDKKPYRQEPYSRAGGSIKRPFVDTEDSFEQQMDVAQIAALYSLRLHDLGHKNGISWTVACGEEGKAKASFFNKDEGVELIQQLKQYSDPTERGDRYDLFYISDEHIQKYPKMKEFSLTPLAMVQTQEFQPQAQSGDNITLTVPSYGLIVGWKKGSTFQNTLVLPEERSLRRKAFQFGDRQGRKRQEMRIPMPILPAGVSSREMESHLKDLDNSLKSQDIPITSAAKEGVVTQVQAVATQDIGEEVHIS